MDRSAHQATAQSPNRLPSSQSMQQTTTALPLPSCQIRPSSSNFSLAFPHSATLQSLLGHASHASHMRSSRTWTPSSAGLGLLSDADEIQDREIFVEEYNRLAKKHGVRLLIVEDFGPQKRGDQVRSPEKRSWFYRLFRGSSGQPNPNNPTPAPRPRHRRSVSDLGYLIHSRRDPPKVVDIRTMVRLSGKSVLYLPQDYSPCSLILPTCIRATAQHIAQNATTRGIFRIPGSVKIVNSLYDYYCYMDNDSLAVAGTVCCATLSTHIHYNVHDVASTFKRLLSVLPGGILGSLSLFDAFVGIHSQLRGEPEFPRTKQTKVRARLIALAIGTIESQFRRELICAVFGLLSLIGRVAEVSPREDAEGRPLPTGDLMGYGALGIVFGPLLVRNLLDQYTMKLATPTSGLLLFPLSPKRQRRDRHKEKAEGNPKLEPPPVDKVMVANNITEMLITNWRDMVRQMKALGTHYRHETASMRLRRDRIPPSDDSFVIKMPQDLDGAKVGKAGIKSPADQDHSPEPETPTMALKRRRSRPMNKTSAKTPSTQRSSCPLSPTIEEDMVKRETFQDEACLAPGRAVPPVDDKDKPVGAKGMKTELPTSSPPQAWGCQQVHFENNSTPLATMDPKHSQTSPCKHDDGSKMLQTPRVYIDNVPPRLSSRHGRCYDGSATASTALSNSDEHSQNAISCKDPRRREQASELSVDRYRTTVRSPLTDKQRCEAPRRCKSPPSQKDAGRPHVIQSNLQSTSRVSDPDPHHHEPGIDSIGLSNSGDSAISPDPKELKRGAAHAVLIHAPFPEVDEDTTLGTRTQDPESSQSGAAFVGTKLLDFISVASDTGSHSRDLSIAEEYYPLQFTGRGTPVKRRSVKAMAAMFKSQPIIQVSPARRQLRSGESHAATHGESLDECLEQSRLIPHQSQCCSKTSPLSPDTGLARNDPSRQVIGVAALMSVEEQGESQEGGLFPDTQQPRSIIKTHGTDTQTEKAPEAMSSTRKTSPSPRESLPAHHVHIGGPGLSPTTSQNGDGFLSKVNSSAPRTPVRVGSTSNLHSKIRQLETLLDIRTTEVAELKRQLDSQESIDVGTLSQQLKETNKDLRMWKERAEAAERRMGMFQKFTTRLRGIQNSIAVESSRQSSGNLQNEWRSELGSKNGGEDAQGTYHVHRVRFAESNEVVGRGAATGPGSDDSGLLEEDGSVVPARIRNCLHHRRYYHNSTRHEAALDGELVTPGDFHGMDGVASPRDDGMAMPDFGLAAVEMWIAAQELLRMQEAEKEIYPDSKVAAGVDDDAVNRSPS